MRAIKTYEGKRDRGEAFVVVSHLDDSAVHSRKLRHMVRHSPCGIEWGYAGSGPADLAFSMLIDHFGGGDIGLIRAEPLYQAFKEFVIAPLPRVGWTMDTTYIDERLRLIELQQASRETEPAAVVELIGAHA